MLATVKDASRRYGGGLRPSLTAAARDGLALAGRDEEMAGKPVEPGDCDFKKMGRLDRP